MPAIGFGSCSTTQSARWRQSSNGSDGQIGTDWPRPSTRPAPRERPAASFDDRAPFIVGGDDLTFQSAAVPSPGRAAPSPCRRPSADRTSRRAGLFMPNAPPARLTAPQPGLWRRTRKSRSIVVANSRPAEAARAEQAARAAGAPSIGMRVAARRAGAPRSPSTRSRVADRAEVHARASHFSQHAQIARDHRRAARHRLEQRQAKPFALGRQQDQRGAPIHGRERPLVDEPDAPRRDRSGPRLRASAAGRR